MPGIDNTTQVFHNLMQGLEQANAFFIFFFLCIAYIAGFLFYRRDVVLPDSVSQLIKICTVYCNWPVVIYVLYGIVFCCLPFTKIVFWYQKRLLKRCRLAPPCSEAAQECKTVYDEWPKCAQYNECSKEPLPGCYVNRLRKYPYEDFNGYYLKKRGIDHLKDYAKWDAVGDGSNTSSRTSKRSTEAYKAVLHYYAPFQCRDIDRLEAHVRLSSSLWYISRTIGIICILYLLFSALSFQWVNSKYNAVVVNVYMLIAAITISYFSAYFLHYLRRKEVFMILQTAYILGESDPAIKHVLTGSGEPRASSCGEGNSR
ncbi:hypothetical protein [Akkermansia glycaniphila]|nr:hypothetical protein [Akkermansia glycaniphila]